MKNKKTTNNKVSFHEYENTLLDLRIHDFLIAILGIDTGKIRGCGNAKELFNQKYTLCKKSR